jgi:hypothetical protein
MTDLRLELRSDAAPISAKRAVLAAPRVGVGRALRGAVADFYEHSWRLVLLNGALSAFAFSFLLATQYLPLSLALALLAIALGPPVLALAHCAVTIVQTDDLQLGDFARGLRLHWRRGFALGSLAAGFVLLTVIAFSFYAGRSTSAWPLAFLVLYLTGLLGVLQLPLWPLAVVRRELPLRRVLRDAALATARRPRASLGLAAALLLVNVLGVAAAVLPFLTMTVAYSFLATAHFFVPRERTGEA